jgi:hypothetical protein
VQRGRAIRDTTAAGLVLAAVGAIVASLQGHTVSLLADGLLAAALAVVLWERLAFLAPAAFAVAAAQQAVSLANAFRADAADTVPRLLLLACLAFATAIAAIAALPSRRGLVPSRHLAWPLAAGAAAGLWWVVLDASGNATRPAADALLGFGFALAAAGLCLPLRGRYQEESP